MIAYLARLAFLSFACFFLVNFGGGVVAAVLTPRAIAKARSMRASSAARFLLAVRLAPSFAALFAVVAMCIPSYLWLEPASTSEGFGIFCSIAAALGLGVIVRSLGRAAGAIRRSRRLDSGGGDEISIIDTPGALMASTGLLRPRVLVSRAAVDSLTAEQFDAAVRHERAHFTARDNLKRLFLVTAPEILPFLARESRLDREWAKFSEWSADDRAVCGEMDRAISLAEALVQLARMRAPSDLPPLATSLLADPAGLSIRVERLLYGIAVAEPPRNPLRTACLIGASTLGCGALANPATLAAVHDLLERFFQ